MNTACVIGNGPSRIPLDLHCINSTMTTYGCNALYRDFMPNYLISMDYDMVKEIINNKIHYKTEFYTQHENRIDKIAETEPIKFFWGHRQTVDSGNCAVQLALSNKHEIIYMIGFDYSLDPSRLPNVYLGTENYTKYHMYPAASMKETKWIQTLSKLLKEYPDQKVVRVTDTKHLDINKPNYSEITIEQFRKIYDPTT